MLYIVATPIGNLNDLSLRQVKTLINSDVILTEDTRSTGLLLNKIKELFPQVPQNSNPPQLISYYKEKEFEKLPEILNFLEVGKTISLISQAGMPLISDPGNLLVQTLIKRNIPFTIIPGATAFTTTFAYSGFDIKPEKGGLFFLGFLPKQSSRLVQLIKRIIQIKLVLPQTVFSFYESPKRINSTLKLLSELMPEANIVIGRELTKKFEEIIRGQPQELTKRTYKGEITVILR